ncbi:MAG: restriction endonuclease subunit S [bacterium]|nr:restriction endonuclease subunit S [bacterium]
MKEPKIRFKGFQGEWEKHSLAETEFSIIAGGDIDRTIFKKCGNYPVIANAITSDGILGYYENSYRVKGPAVTVTGRGEVGVAVPRHYSFTPVVRLLAIKSSHNVDVLANAINLCKVPIESTGVPQLTTSKLQEYNVFMPQTLDEEDKLASYFQHLDSLIQSTTKKIESLKQVKAASLQSMFPQEGETTPRVRFKGFEGEWEEMPFSETFDYLKNNSLSRAELSDGGVVMNIHYGDVLIKYGECVDVGKEVKTFVKEEHVATRLHQSCAITNGDIIFADAAEDNTVGKCSEIIAKEDDAIISGLHTIPCRPMKQFATRYLGYYLNSNAYHNQLLPHIQGIKISSISKKAISQTHINSPLDIAEQRAIASYFTNLDRQISLQSQRLEKLKQIKAACLDNMFV